MVDHYAVLGVARDASTAVVRRAYLDAALRVHPDRAPDDPAAHERFVAVGAAFEVLSDATLRREHDEALRRTAPRKAAAARAAETRQRPASHWLDVFRRERERERAESERSARNIVHTAGASPPSGAASGAFSEAELASCLSVVQTATRMRLDNKRQAVLWVSNDRQYLQWRFTDSRGADGRPSHRPDGGLALADIASVRQLRRRSEAADVVRGRTLALDAAGQRFCFDAATEDDAFAWATSLAALTT